MTLPERLAIATYVLVVAYVVGGIVFFVSRGIILLFVRRFKGEPVSNYWLVGVLGYPAVVVYGFAVHPVVGFVLLLPFLIALLAPEVFFANWKTVQSVRLPERVKLTNPLRKDGDKFVTRVLIDGEDWSAEFSDDGVEPPIPGHFVRIVERRGLKLVLARAEK